MLGERRKMVELHELAHEDGSGHDPDRQQSNRDERRMGGTGVQQRVDSLSDVRSGDRQQPLNAQTSPRPLTIYYGQSSSGLAGDRSPLPTTPNTR